MFWVYTKLPKILPLNLCYKVRQMACLTCVILFSHDKTPALLATGRSATAGDHMRSHDYWVQTLTIALLGDMGPGCFSMYLHKSISCKRIYFIWYVIVLLTEHHRHGM